MDVSVVIPVYNEEGNLPELFTRLCSAMDALGRSWEVIFVNDGSKDDSGKTSKLYGLWNADYSICRR